LNKIGQGLEALLAPQFSIQFSISHAAKNFNKAASNNRTNSRFVGNTAYMSHTITCDVQLFIGDVTEASPAAKGRN
jgi:hypothetical protein